MDQGWFIAYATAIGVLVAGIGVFVSRQVASLTRKQLGITTLVRYLDTDMTKEMGDSIKFLWNVRRGKEAGFENCASMTADEFAAYVVSLRNSKIPSDKLAWDTINAARRPVHKSYLRAMQLKIYAELTDVEAVQFFTGVGLSTVHEILEPIERNMVGGPYTQPVFGEFERLYRNYPRLFRKAHRVDLQAAWPPPEPWRK